jgi:hypothetical protein
MHNFNVNVSEENDVATPFRPETVSLRIVADVHVSGRNGVVRGCGFANLQNQTAAKKWQNKHAKCDFQNWQN